MNDQQLDDLLDQDIPSPDENAKKITINNAMSEFSQGFDSPDRLMSNRGNWFSRTLKSFGSYLMTPQKNSRLNGTTASIAIAFVAVSVYFLIPNLQKQHSSSSAVIEANKKNPTVVQPQTTKELVTASKQSKEKNDLIGAENQPIKIEAPSSKVELEEITVSGSKAVIQSNVNSKRINTQMVDGLTASENADIPVRSIELANAAATSKQLRSRTVESKSIVIRKPQPFPSPRPINPGEPISISPPELDDNEEYPEYEINSVKLVSEAPVSTFSIDVDTASYSLVRNQLNNGSLPKPGAVRAEELINYFDYNYPLPKSRNRPFEPTVTVLDSPWNKGKKLVHIGIKGYEIDNNELPDSNLVFLLDVSGSMNAANKLPLVKQSINLLLDTLKPTDTVSIVVYAGAAGVALEPTQVKNKITVLEALQNLSAGGSTAGGQGIELAYQLAQQNFKKGSVNRIILATDGDFNVGASSNEELKKMVERKREKGVFLSVLGFGRNNYQDDMMQTLAQNGNGVAAYIDTLSEAKKVLVDEATSTLFTIAKDVKIQVEFNPTTVSEYRLIGYETRVLKREDFNNDKVDAGDIGAGHTVTAIYEVTLAGSENQSIDKPRYATNEKEPSTTGSKNEYGYVKIRYKAPTGSKSKLIEQAISVKQDKNTNSEVLFSTAVAGFAQLLAGSNYTNDLQYSDLISIAKENKGSDEFGYRSEFIQLVRMAEIAKP